MSDHLSAPMRELLALYAEKYAQIRFPDLDLGRLQASAEGLGTALERVAEAEATVATLREQARLLEGELTQKAARAIAFLKVYVEGDDTEYARLDALTLALLTRPRARKPEPTGITERTRGRPKKGKGTAGTRVESDETVSEISVEELAEADLPSSALSRLTPASDERDIDDASDQRAAE